MKKILLFILFLTGSAVSFSQTSWLWSKDAVSGSLEAGNDIAYDSISGSVYVCGDFRDDISAQYGSSFTSTYGGQDGFVAKYNSDGTVIWAFKIGGSGTDDAFGITVDNSGNIYVTGSFDNTGQFKGTSSSSATLTSAGNSDAYIAKYNPAGELQWVRQGSNNGEAFPREIAHNSSYIFTTGFFDNNSNFSFGGNSITSNGGDDAYFAIHDLNGNFIKLNKISGSNDDHAHDIAADETNFYIAGSFISSTVNFYNYNGTVFSSYNLLSSGDHDAFYAAYDISTGNPVWTKRIGGSSSENDIAYGIAQEGNYIFIAGAIGPNPTFPGITGTYTVSGEDIFICRAAKATGQCDWAKVETDGSSSNSSAYDIAAKNDKVWITGEFYNTANFSGTSISSSGSGDFFVASYKTDGTLRYAKKAGGNGADKSYGITTQPNGTLYVTGMIGSSVTFDAITISRSNGQNLVVAKLGCNDGSATISGNAQISSGQSTNITITFTGTAPYDYIYTDGSQNYSGTTGASSVTISVNPTVTTTYKLVSLSSGAGCDALLSNLTGSAVITVTSGISNNIISANQAICPGEIPATLTGTTPTGGNGIYIYGWRQSSDSINWVAASGINNLQDYTPGILSNTTYFKRIVTSDTLSSTSNTVSIVVSNITNNAITGNQTLCIGQVPNALTGTTPTGGSGTYTYLWEQSLDGIIWTSALGTNNQKDYAPTTLSVTTYFRRVVSSGSCTPSTSNTVTVTIPSAIANNIISADQTICTGQTASILAGSAPTGGNSTYTYLWQQSLDNLTWANASGTNNLKDYTPGTLTTTIYYRREVTSGSCAPSYSNVLKITVLAAIGNNSISANQTICPGASAATLTGTTPTGGNGTYTYQWQQSTDSISWVTASGTSNTINYTPGSISSTTYLKRIVSSGSCTGTSNVIKITVSAQITNNTISGDQTICADATAIILTGSTPTGGNGTYPYQWQQSADNISWSAASGTNNTKDYNPGSLLTSVYYKRIVTSGSCSHSSNVILITVNPVITNNTISANQTLCAEGIPNELIGSTLSGGDGFYSYQWLESTDNINWINAAGVGNLKNYQPGTLTDTINYKRKVVSETCISESNIVTINVVPGITDNNIASDQEICYGETPAKLNGGLAASPSGQYSYMWEKSTDSVNWVFATGSGNSKQYQPPALYVTTYFRRLVSNDSCANDISNVVKITVSTSISNNIITSSEDTICNGQSAATITGSTPTGGNGNYNYLWEASSDNVSWSSAPGTNNEINYNPQSITTSTYFRRKVTSGNCAGAFSNTIAITVLPSLANNVISSDQIICIGQTAALLTGATPSGGNGTYTYLWEQSSDSLNWMSASGNNTGSTYDPGNLLTTTYFRRKISSGACSGNQSLISNSIAINVVAGISNNIISRSQEVCSNSRPEILIGELPLGGNGVYVYQWEESYEGISWYPALGTNNLKDYLPDTLTQSIYYRRAVYSSGLCNLISYSDSVFIKVNELPDASVSGIDTLCSGTSSPLNFKLFGSGPWALTYSNGTSLFTDNIPDSLHEKLVSPSSTTIYTFLKVSDVNGCEKSLSDTVTKIVYKQPVAFAGNDKSICGMECVLQPIPSASKGWWVYPEKIEDDSVFINGIKTSEHGTYTITWIEQENICFDTATVTVSFVPPLDTVYAGNNQELDFKFTTELDANVFHKTEKGTWTIIQGSGNIEDPENPKTTITNLGTGVNKLRWTVSNGACEPLFKDIEIIVNGLNIPSGFSPNDDQINDAWVIRGIENTEISDVKIFNRWGNVIYTSPVYRNSWNGEAEDGSKLPDDTYYYILNINNESYTGYIIIKR